MVVVDLGFDELVASRYDGLRRAAFVLCGDHGHAEDLVQVTLMKIHRNWRRFRTADNPDAYLHAVLVNTSRTFWRRRWHGERPTAAQPDTTVADFSPTSDLRLQVVQALGGLSAAHREVLALRYLAGLSEGETAAICRCSVGTVKSRTNRALAALRASGALTSTDADRSLL